MLITRESTPMDGLIDPANLNQRDSTLRMHACGASIAGRQTRFGLSPGSSFPPADAAADAAADATAELDF